MSAESSLPPRLLSLGDAAWTVEFDDSIKSASHGRVLGFCHVLDTLSGDGRLDGVVEWLPYVEHPEMMTDWDDKRHMYALEPNQDFVPELERRLSEKGLGKDAPIILICRSGDRSSKVQDRLKMAGYAKVYSTAEGFEGDTAKDGPKAGQRAVNGWNNANLPWTYKLDKAKMYFPR